MIQIPILAFFLKYSNSVRKVYHGLGTYDNSRIMIITKKQAYDSVDMLFQLSISVFRE